MGCPAIPRSRSLSWLPEQPGNICPQNHLLLVLPLCETGTCVTLHPLYQLRVTATGQATQNIFICTLASLRASTYSPPKVNKISSWCEERGRGMPDEQQLGEAQSPGNHLQAARSFVGCKQKTKMLLGMAGKTVRDRQQGRARVMLPATVFKKYRPVFSKGSADSTEGTTKPSEMPVPRCLLLSSRTGAPKPPGRPFTITSAPGNTQTLEAVQSPGKQMELLVLDLGARGQLGTPLLF